MGKTKMLTELWWENVLEGDNVEDERVDCEGMM
jgi:hypothetical protein